MTQRTYRERFLPKRGGFETRPYNLPNRAHTGLA
jgi:hypothetical protein